MNAAHAGPIDGSALRRLAVELAEAAGAVLREHRAGSVTVAATKSSPTDVVTAADLAAETELRRLLAEARPDDGVLGEEEGLVAGSSGLTWVLDPLDGTVNFLYDVPAYAVSVAVVTGDAVPARWEAVAGAVHDVTRSRTYSAAAGRGADLDGRPLRPSPVRELSMCLLGTGFSYRPELRARQADAVAALLPRVRDVRRIGSAALDICMVAGGVLDGYVECGLKPWDHAAAALIAREAGAVVRGPDRSATPASGLTVVSAPGVATQLWDAVAASGYPTQD